MCPHLIKPAVSIRKRGGHTARTGPKKCIAGMGTMSKKTNSSKGKGKIPAVAKAEAKVVPSKGGSKTSTPSKAPEKGSKELKTAIPGAPGVPSPPKRKLGLRGAAPWAARHAAKHAAEARARAAEPPPPGSARATIRVPTGA